MPPGGLHPQPQSSTARGHTAGILPGAGLQRGGGAGGEERNHPRRGVSAGLSKGQTLRLGSPSPRLENVRDRERRKR